MATVKNAIQVYIEHLRGRKIIVIHGTSFREVNIAKQLTEQLVALGSRGTEYFQVSVKELGRAIEKAKHVVLVFNSLENFRKKLRHSEEFTGQICKMRQNELVVVCKAFQIPNDSPLIHFMRFGFDEVVEQLATKCVTIFGGNLPFCHV